MTRTMANHRGTEVAVQVRERFNLKLSRSTLQDILEKSQYSYFGWNYSGERNDRERIALVLYYGDGLGDTQYLSGMPVA